MNKEIIVCILSLANCQEPEMHERQERLNKMNQIKQDKLNCVVGYEIYKKGEQFYFDEKKVCVNKKSK